ncbi:hypothetical protein [Tranquillimonas rosea]|uniref:hypothetical protein n=1 Tax=Tranquillimonas rosea TaxID=641238 RepID=UPI003BABFDCD
MTDRHLIRLQWPAKALWPNGGRGHRMAHHRATKSAKNEAFYAAKAAGVKPGDHPPHLIVTHYPKTANTPDKDNCIAAFKARQDGLAMALSVNDRDLTSEHHIGEPVKGGCVLVEVVATEAPA